MIDAILQNQYLKEKNIFTQYNENIDETRKDYENISDVFGKDNVLGIKTIKISKENIEKINKDEGVKLLNEMRAYLKKDLLKEEDWNKIKDFVKKNNIEIPIVVQEKFITDDKQDIVDFSVDFPTEEVFEIALKKDQLINGYQNTKKILDHGIIKNKFLSVIDSDTIEVKNLITDLIRKCIKYSKETHKLIDFFGEDNILFYKENDVYRYKLIDPVLSMNTYSTDKKIQNTSVKDFLEKNRNEIIHIYSYLKTLNVFAEKLGIDERLKSEDILGTKVQGVEKEVNEYLK
jgi:hypothetical protein